MSRRFLVLSALGLLVVGLLAAACSSGSDAGNTGPTDDGADLTRTAEADGITVDATWLTEESAADVDADLSAYPLDRFVAVKIAFTTHSGDLNKIAMEEAATLQTRTETLQPEAWVSLSDDSHHREGVVVFSGGPETGSVELLLELEGGEVSLQWETIPDS
ncbi:MAG: hypothetical protein AAB092_04420 [Chloroflexota bacterium]